MDDNVEAAELLADCLTAVGYEVRVACSGPDALREVERFSPALTLIDIELPEMNGYELAPILRQRGATRHMVALTGRSEDDARARSFEAGFEAHVVKPVILSELRSLITRLIGSDHAAGVPGLDPIS